VVGLEWYPYCRLKPAILLNLVAEISVLLRIAMLMYYTLVNFKYCYMYCTY